jgi:hypothetical protein
MVLVELDYAHASIELSKEEQKTISLLPHLHLLWPQVL